MTAVREKQQPPAKTIESPATLNTITIIGLVVTVILFGASMAHSAMTAFVMSGLLMLLVIINLLITAVFPYKTDQGASLKGVLIFNSILLFIAIDAIAVGVAIL